MNMSSLCVRWMDWLGYLASIRRTALGARCGGANDWASRAEPPLASAVSEHACRENPSSGRGPLQYGCPALQYLTLLHNHTYNIHGEFSSMGYNEAFRCCILLWEKALKVFWNLCCILCALFYVFLISAIVCGSSWNSFVAN